MRRRVIALFLCFVLLFSIFSMSVSAASIFDTWLVDPYTTSQWDNNPVWKFFNQDSIAESLSPFFEDAIAAAVGFFTGNPALTQTAAQDALYKLIGSLFTFDGDPAFYAVTDTDLEVPWDAVTFVDWSTLSNLKALLEGNGFDIKFGTRAFDFGKDDRIESPYVIQMIPDAGSIYYPEVGSVNTFLSDIAGRIIAAWPTGSATTGNRNDYLSGTTTGNTTINNYGDTNNTTNIHYAGDTINNETINNNQVYDYSTNQWVEAGDIQYDYSTQTYTTNDVTNNYSYQYNYYIDYTSVTYIGSSAEYEIYKVYYELPDGRNSADLTLEDLEQIALTYDVINYGVAADDGRLRYLNHFDGVIEDVSYWSNYTSFDWVSNPSITYLETANFGGALYLDENAHQFTITLPSNLAASDFSVLFRYYHSANESTTAVNEMQVLSGSSTLATVTTGNLTTLSNVPTGQWNELAIIRDGSTLYFYVNGVVKSTSSLTAALGDTVTFDFLAQQTYRYFDELRVYNYSFVEAGADYTPVSVPVDTNAVLVLPDEAFPVPDAYWDFNTDGNLLRYQDFSQGQVFANSSYMLADNDLLYNFPNYAAFLLNTTYYSYNTYSDHISISPTSSRTSFDSLFSGGYSLVKALAYPEGNYFYGRHAFAIPLNAGIYNYYNLTSGSTYTFSIMTSDESIYSLTFQYGDLLNINTNEYLSYYYCKQKVLFDNLAICFAPRSGDYSRARVGALYIIPRSTIDIIYMELVAGSTPNTGHKYVTEIYSSLDLTRPTIAVRSLIPIRSYRIGSVRPTLPYRGDVWMMVENSKITSIQIYTGYMWQEVDGRIWTGTRWSSLLFYDILTQQDYSDIIGTTDNEYIQSAQGFYDFMVKQMKEVVDALNVIVDGLSNVTAASPDMDLNFTLDGVEIQMAEVSYSSQGGLWSIFKGAYELVFYKFPTSGIFGVIPSISQYVIDFINAFGFGGTGTIVVDGESSYTVGSMFEGSVWD